jgi:hypothetical protein
VQEGLHIGVAAWVNAQRGSDAFATWPAMPLPTELTVLETVQTMADLARAAEFARMVNFTPRKGLYAEPFTGKSPLWETHRRLLGRMLFAIRPWTAEEDAQFSAARAKLYVEGANGFPTMTPAFKLYDELRIAYDALVAAGAGSAELAAAHAAWTLSGHKVEIEAALATVNRLARRSSVVEAEAERLALEPDRLLSTVDGSYAATTFSPLSAVREDAWLRAEATFDELDQAVGDAEPRGKWTAWRAARTGSLRFAYTVLDLHRPWFTQTLYEADDWRFGDQSVAAKGDGVGGEIPAYVRSVYVARVEDVRNDPIPQSETGATPPWQTLGPELSVSYVAREGVAMMAGRRAPLMEPATVSPVVRRGPVLATRAPGWAAREARFGRLERITLADVTDRISLANDVLAGEPSASPDIADGEPARSPPYVVGFGCAALPVSPLPNPSYLWTYS